MIYRNEEKHLISFRQYEIIKKRIEKIFKVDNNCSDDKEYLVRSVYFDDYLKKSVQDNLQGLKERYKYRVRLYNLNTDIIKLEKKVKDNEQGYKRSVIISKAEYLEIINGNYDLISERKEPLIEELIFNMKVRLLRPLITIEYRREPYILPFNNIRVTFDKNITYSRAIFYSEKPLANTPVLDEIVMEIKYNHFLPMYLRKLFSVDSIQKKSISKYIICYKHSLGEEVQI